MDRFKPITNKQFAEFIQEQQQQEHFNGNVYDFTHGFIDNLNKLFEDTFYERNIDWNDYHHPEDIDWDSVPAPTPPEDY